MLGGGEAALRASASANTLSDYDNFSYGDALLPGVLQLVRPLIISKAQQYRYRRLRWAQTGQQRFVWRSKDERLYGEEGEAAGKQAEPKQWISA